MNRNWEQPSLVVAVNSAIALGFLQGQLQFFQNQGFDVTALCPERRHGEWEVARPEEVQIIEVPIEREIAPRKDLASLWRLWRIMRAKRPTITNVGTPKAGLLGGFAAWLSRVPCRIYTLHGLRFETTKGLQRQLLIWAERLACSLAHRVICVSHSVEEKAIASRLTTRKRLLVLGSGSCNGVDASRFAPSPQLMKRAAQLRRELGIPMPAPVVLFVGRLTRDKGIPELAQAFGRLAARFPELRMLLVGCFEHGDPLPPDTRAYLESNSRVIFAGAVQDTAPYYATADMLVLPSHREGLPTVILEAQAAGIPVVGASATGIIDVVADGKTGLLFPVGDAAALAEAIARLLADDGLANQLRLAGQEQVQTKFQQERIWEELHKEYFQVLESNGFRWSFGRHLGEQKDLLTSSSK
ncbi:MAG TPA: glycosyltransferase family 4 protein [Candidatus Acidoferrum sp.]|nr:glycosyltransferase family 4 protein [Candidatus Acidoferrum sp.]